jgi:hypothetical protein
VSFTLPRLPSNKFHWPVDSLPTCPPDFVGMAPTEGQQFPQSDPPFNSKRDCNVLCTSPKGHESQAQSTAFEDSWHWGEQAEREFDELVHAPNSATSWTSALGKSKAGRARARRRRIWRRCEGSR